MTKECTCEVFLGDSGCPVHGMATGKQLTGAAGHWEGNQWCPHKPTGAAEPWTARAEADRLYLSTGYWDIGEMNARTLAVTINAAIRAEQEKVHLLRQERAMNETELVEQLRNQLASEREKVENLHKILGQKRMIIKELREKT